MNVDNYVLLSHLSKNLYQDEDCLFYFLFYFLIFFLRQNYQFSYPTHKMNICNYNSKVILSYTCPRVFLSGWKKIVSDTHNKRWQVHLTFPTDLCQSFDKTIIKGKSFHEILTQKSAPPVIQMLQFLQIFPKTWEKYLMSFLKINLFLIMFYDRSWHQVHQGKRQKDTLEQCMLLISFIAIVVIIIASLY